MAENEANKNIEKKSQIKSTLDTLLNGMDGFISSKSVIGEPIIVGDTTLVPLVDVSFAVGAGAGSESGKNTGCGGIGGKMTPNSVLMIQGGHARLISVKKQDGFTKIMDLIPDLVSRFTEKSDGTPDITDDDAIDTAFDEKNE